LFKNNDYHLPFTSEIVKDLFRRQGLCIGGAEMTQGYGIPFVLALQWGKSGAGIAAGGIKTASPGPA
jgi:hypothetical protein